MIELTETYPTGTVIKSGGDTFEIAEGIHLMIGSNPPQNLILDLIVPAGKKWFANISVQVREVDA
jgi:hypothetical protein